MVKPFPESDFCVTFRGECPTSRIVRGWDRVIAYVDYELGANDDGWSLADEDVGVCDSDNWQLLGSGDSPDDDLRHVYSTEIGECVYLTITRLTEPVLDEILAEQA